MSWESLSPNFTSTVSLLLLTGRISRLYVLSRSSYRRFASGFAVHCGMDRARATQAATTTLAQQFLAIRSFFIFHFIAGTKGPSSIQRLAPALGAAVANETSDMFTGPQCLCVLWGENQSRTGSFFSVYNFWHIFALSMFCRGIIRTLITFNRSPLQSWAVA